MATVKTGVVGLVTSAALAHSARVEQYLREGRTVSGGSTPGNAVLDVKPLFPENLIEELIDSIAWDEIPDGTMSNGKPYKTTRVQSFSIVKDGYRFQFSGSINRYMAPQDKAARANTRGLARAVDRFEVTDEQKQALDPEALAAVNTLKKLRDEGKI